MLPISPTGPAGGVSPTPDLQTQKLQSIINEYYASAPDTARQAGCNLVIMKPGVKEPVCLNAGKLPPNKPQGIASCSKMFTAACIDKLVKDGKIKYDDDIRKYLHELPQFMWESQPQTVTIDDLVHMRSGFPELGIWSLFSSGNEKIMLSIDERRELLAQCPALLFKPGSQQMMYSNDNYYLLADIVARVSGKPFVDFVRDEIFVPLEMKSRYSVDPECPQTAEGYNSKFEPQAFSGHAWGAYGIVGPPTDMAKWNEDLASGKWEGLMSPPPNVPTVPNGESVYCRGLKVAYTEDYRVVYHSGSIDGFCTRFMRFEHLRDESKTFAFFLATNINDMELSLNAAEAIANVLANKEVPIVKDELSEISPPTIPTKASMSEARPYVGEYERPALGLRYKIEAEDKDGVPVLHFSLLGKDKEWHPLADLDPTKKEENPVVYLGPAGERLDLTPDGVVLSKDKMASIVFKRRVNF